MLEEKLLLEANDMASDLIRTRRKLHQHPEIGDHEFETSAFVTEQLEALGLEVLHPVGTSVIGILRGSKPGKTAALRADMDALPVQEETGLPFASEVPGMMHACGHDIHTTAALGAARILTAHREELSGNVKFFFQPNEEGTGGAERMVKAGCMDNPHVDAVFGGHVDPEIPVGQIGIRYGKAYAASNPFVITLHGASSHGAQPDRGLDPIVCGAQIVSAVQTLVSRRTSPTDACVVTFGSFQAGTAGNIIPPFAKMQGIIRTLGPETRERITREFVTLVQGVAKAMGLDAEVQVSVSYPGIVNDDAPTDLVKSTAERMLGGKNVLLLREPTMGTEDFGFFASAAMGSFIKVGVSHTQEPGAPLHSDHFDPDERALPIAAALYASSIWNYLA